MDNFDYLGPLHRCQLLIAEEIKRLCEKHRIPYFIIAGTLLGAVRHGGFIPWDDDMDIGMLRPDYERFLEVAGAELSEKFFLQTAETDRGYGLPIAKVLLRGTVLTENATAGNSAQKGIFVDVFPFDVRPEDEKKAASHDKKTYFWRRVLLAKCGYAIATPGQWLKKAVYCGLRVLACFYSKKTLCARLNREITRYNGERSDRIVNIGGAYGYEKETICRKWVDETRGLPFEETSLAAPAGYIAYLESFYGDYMTPPPENKRYNRHGVVELDFGEYRDI